MEFLVSYNWKPNPYCGRNCYIPLVSAKPWAGANPIGRVDRKSKHTKYYSFGCGGRWFASIFLYLHSARPKAQIWSKAFDEIWQAIYIGRSSSGQHVLVFGQWSVLLDHIWSADVLVYGQWMGACSIVGRSSYLVCTFIFINANLDIFSFLLDTSALTLATVI